MPKLKNTISDITIKNRKRNIHKNKSVQILDAVTENEYYRMMENCSNERDRNIIKLLWNTGLRRQELCWLDCNDVINKDILVLRQEIAKGAKSRFIPLTGEAKEAILFFIQNNRQRGFRITKHLPLIISKKNARMSTKQVYQIVKKAGKTIGQDISPHDLRAGFATYLLGKGGLINDIQLLLGHSNYDVTARAYLKRNMDDLKRTMDLFNS